MVEVVGQDESAAKFVTHSNCGARLKYFPKDIVLLWSGKDYGGGSDGAKGFNCPQCGENVIIERW